MQLGQKVRRLRWASVFRDRALTLIDQEQLEHRYHADNGRPNRAVQTACGVLLLKETLGLTDAAALDLLEFHILWQHVRTRCWKRHAYRRRPHTTAGPW